MPSCSSSLSTTTKPEAKHNARIVAMLLFYIIRKYNLGEVAYFNHETLTTLEYVAPDPRAFRSRLTHIKNVARSRCHLSCLQKST
jgi:hypothetical protein